MRCLVTGGLGFIGSAIVERLHSMGHEVWVLDNRSSPSDHPRDCFRFDRVLIGSINYFLNIPKMGYGPKLPEDFDAVFHTAAIARTVPCIENPKECHDVNATGAMNVFARFGGGARVVHCSSNVVLGVPTTYRASKLAAEHYLEAYNHLYGTDIIGLRFSNVIGPYLRKGDGAVLSMLRDCRAEHGFVNVTGDGTQTRNFTSVQDVTDACMIAAFESDYKGIVDITTGRVTDMNEFAAFFKCPIKYIGDRKGDTPHIHQSPEDAKRILGWQSKVTLEEEMERCLA